MNQEMDEKTIKITNAGASATGTRGAADLKDDSKRRFLKKETMSNVIQYTWFFEQIQPFVSRDVHTSDVLYH